VKHSFEEFKLYYESTEKVTDRRIANNQWNYSVCVAMIVAIALAWSWSVTNTHFAFLTLTVLSVLTLIGALFAGFWIQQISDFKALNHAKFTVLNDMAPNVAFTLQVSPPDPVISANPFQREWEYLEHQNALVRLTGRRFTALKSSNIEYYLPQTLRIVFLFMFSISALPIIAHPVRYALAWREWIHLLGR